MSTRSKFRVNLQLEAFESRTVPSRGFGGGADDTIAVTPDDGGVPRVRIIDPTTGEDVAEIQAFEDSFRGGVHAALGDVTGDGIDDAVIAAGTGGSPRVRIIDGSTQAVLADFLVYEASFTGGVYVAVGDVNGDGKGDIITGTGNGGGPRVRVLDGATLGRTVLKDYFPYEDTFRGGVLVAAGDINGDGRDDIITGTGVGGGPRVEAIDARDDRVLRNFFAYESTFRGGVLVSAGDLDGDGKDDIITGTGPGGGPLVRAIAGADGRELANFLADDSAFRGGVRVGSDDVNGDGRHEIVAHTRHGNDDRVQLFDPATGMPVRDFSRPVDDNPHPEDGGISGGSGGSGPGSGTSGSGSGSGDTTTTTREEGTVVSVDTTAGTVTIRRADGTTVVVRTGPGTDVERNEAHTTLASFRSGDAAEARIGSDGIAWKVEATGP